MPRKKSEDKVKVEPTPEEAKLVADMISNLTKPTHKLKICCHAEGLPEVCEVFELPFQPRNGDIICVKPKTANNESSRMTFPLRDLVYDVELGFWQVRTDIVEGMNEHFKRQNAISTELNPLGT